MTAADQMTYTATVPWSKLDHALSLVADGTLSIDSEGRVWRHFEKTKGGRRAVETRRADRPTTKGYMSITFSRPGRTGTRSVLVHVLVWTLANGSIPAGLQVNHKDLNKANNRLDNLEAVTGARNIQHSYENGRTRPWSKATEWRPGKPCMSEELKARVVALRAGGHGARAVSKMTGVSATHVDRLYKKWAGK